MGNLYLLCGIMIASVTGGLAACSSEALAPSEASAPTISEGVPQAATGNIRLRCERRSNRSKISVDGRSLSPSAGTFRARVRAAGGTATSGTRRAVGGEAEFDFDSDPGDVREGATPIAATFIRARAGADVVAEILNSQGRVVASSSGDCASR
ncbi:MAG TPA: hypothetical protein VG500_07450 [Gemmatimonadales bacterium]|jgi:hypothetical protein|nr:hypothetical protein [Gemmatimonadales bacterium]